MKNILAIYRRELSSYFDSPLAYIVIPVFLGLVGGFSLYFQDLFASPTVSMRSVFFWCAVCSVLLIPAITMRLFAEERRSGSLELLVTLPITESELVAGKYLAAVSLVAIALLLTASYPLTLSTMGQLDLGPVAGGYLGLLLLSAAFTAIGTAASAFTSNQIIAFFVALVACLVPFAMGFALAQVPAGLLPLVQYLSFETHFNNLARGVIDSRNIVFYLSVCAFFVHLAVFGLEHRRLS
jgi:ABC-2 type transport system permease protein